MSSGVLRCTGCGRRYPIEEGIPRLLRENLCGSVDAECASDSVRPADTDEATARKRSEMQARDDQVGDYDRMWYLNLFGKVEIPLTLKHLDLKRQHMLLEGGCGTGRMTPEFAGRCERLISIDFSWESLKVCAGKLRRAGITNVDLVQADLCHLPFGTDVFDRVVSCQVLEHIPTPDCRAMAVRELSRVLQPGQNLVLSAYQNSLLTRLFGQKEGEHDGGIYFYRFERKELRRLLSTALDVEAITGIMVYHYIARCRKDVRD